MKITIVIILILSISSVGDMSFEDRIQSSVIKGMIEGVTGIGREVGNLITGKRDIVKNINNQY